MTPYETQSLEIARNAAMAAQNAVTAYVVADVLAGMALVTSAVAGWLIYHQLKSFRWNALLSFEQDMHGRYKEIKDFAQQIHPVNPLPNERAIYDTLEESYLNAVDRLASSILNGQFPMKEMKQDYREYISNVVRDFRDQFGADTKYRKILRLYNKWQD